MRILVIAPHPDDEILGVGGTIAKHSAKGNEVFVSIVTKGCEPLFSPESVEMVRKECVEADRLLGVKETIFLNHPAAMLENVPRYKLNDDLVKLVQEIKPDEVYLPHRGDMQLDHKMVVDAAMVALRPKYKYVPARIMAYETLSETGWDIPDTVNAFIPNIYNDISDYLEIKRKALNMFNTQIADFPDARSLEAVESLARFRGASMHMNAAEAFSLIREIIR
jgi:LmbE family N-acetylglucosaminyl deacetylase